MSTDRPRVLFLTTSFPLHRDHWSGVFVLRQAAALTRLGCDLSILAPGATDAAMHEEMNGIAVHRFSYPGYRGHPLAYGGGIPANLRHERLLWLSLPTFTAAFRRQASRLLNQVDLVHAHWSFAGVLATLPGIASRRPLVVSFHGSDLSRPTGPFAWAAKRAAQHASLIVVHSAEMKNRAMELGVSESNLLVIPHGIEADECPIASPNGLPVRLLTIGRLCEEKGFDVLLAALGDLPPTLDWRLEMVGEGPWMERLNAQAESLGLSKRVRFTGPLPPSEVRNRLAASDILLVPSRREGFGVVALEAMAAGLPVVGSAVGALPFLIRPGETGVLAPPGDSAALATAMSPLLADPALRVTLGRSGRALVERDYSLVAANRPLAEAYRRMLGNA